MTKNIGPSFAGELQAAGLTGLPFTWGSDGTFNFDPAMSQQQINAVMVVYEAHDPSKPAVPYAVTKLQLVRALRNQGKEDQFRAALEAAPAQIQSDWQDAIEISRHDPLVIAFSQGLGLSNAEVDTLFIAASQIEGS